MNRALMADDETHRLAKTKAAIAGMYLKEFVRAAIQAADPAKLAKPRRASKPVKPAG